MMLRTNRKIVWLIIAFLSSFLLIVKVSSSAQKSQPPRVDHILLEVKDLKTSISFYRDFMGLHLTSKSGDFATLEAGNIGVYLWEKRWNWENPRRKGERQGLWMYPHFAVANVGVTIQETKKKGYKIIQEPQKYSWGTEAFLADPDGYIWSLITETK